MKASENIAAVSSLLSFASGVWVQGQLYQSCNDVCSSINGNCVPSGPWPMSETDMSTIASMSVDLSTCTNLPNFGDCSMSNCPFYDPGNPIPQDPEGDSSICYYGWGVGTCDAPPDGDFRRFCPCLGTAKLNNCHFYVASR